MGNNIFKGAHFHDEEAARKWFEDARWPNGPICPHCKSAKHYGTKKAGRYRCGNKACRKDFTVMTGTVMERSHAKLTQWATAFWLGASSKKGFSAHQLHRALGWQYNTAWFLHHRVMEAMRMGGLDLPPLGGPDKIVEADETYFGPVEKLPPYYQVEDDVGRPEKRRTELDDPQFAFKFVLKGKGKSAEIEEAIYPASDFLLSRVSPRG